MKRLVCCILMLCLLMSVNVSAVGVSAKAAILINADTGEVIYEHNADERLPMASTTKIMTGLLLCERGDLSKEITVTAEMLRVEGSSMGLLAGDKVTLHDLLYGLLLASGNDAANVIAYILGGTVDGFAKMMNDKAREIGLKNTNFVTPSGLDSAEHYTTARDLAVLTRYALQNEEFKKAVSTKTAVLCYGNPPYKRSITNHNKLLSSFEGTIGVKTGFTKKSGRCLVSAAKRDGKMVIAVTLNDPNDWKDHKELLEYGLEIINTTLINPEKNEYKIPVLSGCEKSVSVKVEPYTVNTLGTGEFSCEVDLARFVYAPVNKGDIVGYAVYKNGDSVVERLPLYAESNVAVDKNQKGVLDKIKENIKDIFLGIWVK